MIRFALLLLLSLGLSSQAIAAVKWNNSGSGSDKSLSTVNEGDGKKIPSWLMQELAKVMHNGLEKKMVLHENNAINADELKFVRKDNRDAILIDLTYEDEGGKSDWRRFGEPGFAQRVQIKLSDLFAVKKGEERWYKLSYYLEGDNLTPNEGNNNTAHQLSLFDLKIQAHSYKDIGVGFNYAKRSEQNFSFDFIQDTEGEQTLYAGLIQYEFPRYFFYLNSAASSKPYHDRWVDVVLNIKWSDNGYTRVWLDNELIINAAWAPLGGKPTKQYSFKFGPYRNHMPPNRRAPDIRVYYADVGLEESCEALLPNCENLKKQITSFEMIKNIAKKEVCTINSCEPVKDNFISMTKLKLERFVGRRVWENKVINLQQNQLNLSGQIETSTIIKDKSPVRAMTYYFSLSSDNKSGKVAFIDGVSNDGLHHSNGTPLSFALTNENADKIENNCGIKLIGLNGSKFPTFSMEEANKISFSRFGYETELLSEKSKCQIHLMDSFSDRYWFELLHLAGKSLRGSNVNGNIAASGDELAIFEDVQQKVKVNIKR